METTINFLINNTNYKIPETIDSSEVPQLSRGARIAFHDFITVTDEDKKYIGQERPTDEKKNDEQYPRSLKQRIATLKSLNEQLDYLKKESAFENIKCLLKVALAIVIVAALALGVYGWVGLFTSDYLTGYMIAGLASSAFSIVSLGCTNFWHAYNSFDKKDISCETACCKTILATIFATIFPPLAIGLPIFERYYKAEKLKSDIKENEALIVKTLDTYKKLIGQDVKEKIQEKMKTVLEETNKTVEENQKINDGKLKLVTGQVQYNNLVEARNTIDDLEKFFKKFEIQK